DPARRAGGGTGRRHAEHGLSDGGARPHLRPPLAAAGVEARTFRELSASSAFRRPLEPGIESMALVHIVGAHVGGGERLRELARYRELVANLTARDLKLKYKGSVLGVAWSLLNPVLMMAIYTAVFSVFLRAVRVPNYWALILTGILPWTFFASSVNGAATSFVRNPNLISKVYFPVEALTLSVVLANFVNLLIPMPILLGILLVAGVHLGPSLILLPVVLLANLALMAGLALAIA